MTSDDASPLLVTERPLGPLFGQQCGDCSRICRRLLRRVGVDSAYFTQVAARQETSCDELYLQPSNPRLVELRTAYADVAPPELAPSIWCSKFLANEVPFQLFRGDCAYVWQRRDLNTPVSYLLTAYYLITRGEAAFLSQLAEDGAFGAYTIAFDDHALLSRDLLDSVNELAFLRRHDVLRPQSPATVLDIGSGYGRFAHRVYEAYRGVHKVLCADSIAESTFLCEYYLRHRGVRPDTASVILLQELIEHPDIWDADLAVNIHSFSECTLPAIAWWLSFLQSRRVRYLFIVPNRNSSHQPALLSTERDRRHCRFEELVESHGYRLLTCEPKYATPQMQRYGVTPTYYYLFELHQ